TRGLPRLVIEVEGDLSVFIFISLHFFRSTWSKHEESGRGPSNVNLRREPQVDDKGFASHLRINGMNDWSSLLRCRRRQRAVRCVSEQSIITESCKGAGACDSSSVPVNIVV